VKAATEELQSVRVEGASCPLLSGVCGITTGATPAAEQARWASMPLRARLRVLRAARHLMAARAEEFSEAISPQLARTKADTLATELLPLLAGCKFLEREAGRILATQRLGMSGRPLWMTGVAAEIHRVALGHVLVIGPSNFPLFIPGSQVLQALAAGNRVTWKPGLGGAPVAQLMARMLIEAGLPPSALTVTDESVEVAREALAAGPDKVIFTGSTKTSQGVLAELAATTTPAVLELSGADAIVVTPTADLQQVARAVAFGLRLNGGSVCMSPRRLFATPTTMSALRPLLHAEVAKVPGAALDTGTSTRLRTMLDEAAGRGAEVQGTFAPEAQKPLLVDHATADMAIARNDIFAPVLSLIEAESMLHVPALYAQCSYGLTVAIFCARDKEKKARMLGEMLDAGTLLINDIIAPTADPRVPFGGRGASGYGVTRGAEGLLEMTAVRTVLIRRGGVMLHLDPTTDKDAPMFSGMIRLMHGKGLAMRWAALKQMVKGLRSKG
jgi:acyl-CoA reductase-like NAD-dependent aldehyde dehydrogenase